MSIRNAVRTITPAIRDLVNDGTVIGAQLADALMAVLDEHGGSEWTEHKAMHNLGSVSLALVEGRGVFVARALGGVHLSDEQLERALMTVNARLANTLQLEQGAIDPTYLDDVTAACTFDTQVPEDVEGIAQKLLVGTSGAELHMNGPFGWRIGLLHPNADIDLDEVAERAEVLRADKRGQNVELDLDLDGDTPEDDTPEEEPDDEVDDDEALSPLEALLAASRSDLAVEVIPLDGSELTDAAAQGFGDLVGLLAPERAEVLAVEVDNDGGRFPAGVIYFDDEVDTELPTGTLFVSGMPPVYVRPF